jgi:hypothetical protein
VAESFQTAEEIEAPKLDIFPVGKSSSFRPDLKHFLNISTDMGQSDIIDPCNDYDCSAETIHVSDGFCRIFEKGPFDYDCFLPCKVDNCTTTFVPGHLCTEFFCEPAPSPSPLGPNTTTTSRPPDPTTTLTPSPSPFTEPTPSLPLEAVVGISCAGKIPD